MSKSEAIVPEVIENPELDQVITTTLTKHNVTDAVIASLKDKYGDLSLKSIDDKESYLIIKEAKKEVRKWGILCEKICSDGRADAVKTQKLWIKKEKEILGKIADVQDPLDKEIARYDAEVERKETEEKKRKEDAAIQRQSELSRMGARYENGCFVLNDVSFDAATIKEADEDVWSEHMLPKYKIQYEKIEAARIEEENKKAEAAKKLKEEQDELERQKKELKDAQDKLLKDQEDAAKKQRDEQEKQAAEARKKLTERTDARINQLRALGMSFSGYYNAYVYEDVNVDNITEINLLDDAEWTTLVNKITPVIADRKLAAEEKKKAELKEQQELAKRQATGNARFVILSAIGVTTESKEKLGEILEDEWTAMHESYKKAWDKKQQEKWAAEQAEKKKQEDAKKAEELAQAGDKEKWNAIVAYMNAAPWHDMKSGPYRKKVAIAKEKIEEINSL
jgi:hypothetical protein